MNEPRPPVRLRPLRTEDEPAALAAHAELAEENFEFLLGYEAAMSWSAYLDLLAARRRGEQLPVGFVPSTFLAAESGGELIGRTSIRHDLNPFLEREGGHIGFGVRRHHRGKGFAAVILDQSLVIARSVGIDQVLVTCDEDNVGSASVIEGRGGRFESSVIPEGGGTPVRRYWIP